MKVLRFGIVVCVLAVFTVGCGQKSPTSSGGTGKATKAEVPLPEWAPKDPSPEFVRATRVLKPIPPEIWASAGEKAGPEIKAIVARLPNTYASAWEFFGTLNDEEIERLRSSGSVRVPFRSMTKSQRRILDAYFEVWRKAMAGQEVVWADWLVELYKEGAREDLSNVDAGFRRDSDRGVNIQFWITQSDGSVRTPSSTVAFM